MRPGESPKKPQPRLLGLVNRNWIEGDDALLKLASQRLAESAIGVEYHPGAPAQLTELRQFVQPGQLATLHLPYRLNPFNPADYAEIVQFTRNAADWVSCLVLHDGQDLQQPAPLVAEKLKQLQRQIDGAAIKGKIPFLAIEYAAKGDIGHFAQVFRQLGATDNIRACIDVGHVGLAAIDCKYGEFFPGERPSLKFWPAEPTARHLLAYQAALAVALPAVLNLIKELRAEDEMVAHYHLHDAHPFSRLSPYGVNDHLSFFQEIRLPDSLIAGLCPGENVTPRLYYPGIFGPGGLRQIVEACDPVFTATTASCRPTLTLEIHPQPCRVPLENYQHLFSHWMILDNAETMLAWMTMLGHNAGLLRTFYS